MNARRVGILGLAMAALLGMSSPSSATTRNCLGLTYCAGASAGSGGSHACSSAPAGEAQDVCDDHGGSGYVHHLTCGGYGDGPGTVRVTGCGTTSADGLGFAAVFTDTWTWSSSSTLCHTANTSAVFNGTLEVKASETYCASA